MISIDLINVAERPWLALFKKLKIHLCHSNNMRFNAFMVFSMKMELHQMAKLYHCLPLKSSSKRKLSCKLTVAKIKIKGTIKS
jgi:hypothetical protein